MAKKYYELSPDERLALLQLSDQDKSAWRDNQSDNNAQIVENYITDFRLPMGILQDIIVNGRQVSVPMAIEEPSVIAAANNGAKMLNAGGGVQVVLPKRSALIGQLLFTNIDFDTINQFVLTHQQILFECAKQAKPSIYKRGGGLLSVVTRRITDSDVSVDFTIDTKDAMGANIVNTILEAETTIFSDFKNQFIGAILSNYAIDQLVTVTGRVPFANVGGQQVAEKIVSLSKFSKHDIYRATTENKGLFNGLSAVVMATGNDWRAVEASGHAYASHNGQYQSLTTWSIKNDYLQGELTLPISVGTVGGAISAMPQAQRALRMMAVETADQLRGIILAVGLAQNLAALKAIVAGGIQQGHMKMQYRALAIQVGATIAEVQTLVTKLRALKQVDTEIAKKILMEMRDESKN